jgi:hypothetical protein
MILCGEKHLFSTKIQLLISLRNRFFLCQIYRYLHEQLQRFRNGRTQQNLR